MRKENSSEAISSNKLSPDEIRVTPLNTTKEKSSIS